MLKLLCWTLLNAVVVVSSSQLAPQHYLSTTTRHRHRLLQAPPQQHGGSLAATSSSSSSSWQQLRGGARTAPPKTATAAVAKPASTTSLASTTSSSLQLRLKIGFYFGLWYALNIYYNIVNKKVLNVLPLPLMVGSLQFGIGCLYVLLLWLLRLRACPTLSSQARIALAGVGFWHCAGQLLSMVSLGAGPVSFTHIVKALEPFFSAAVSALWLNQWMAWPVYLTLVPVVGGVGYACLKEREFSWLSFYMAMGSNVAFAFRAVLSKAAMTAAASSKHLTSTNIFGVVTIFAFLMSIPTGLVGEGYAEFLTKWKDATTAKVVEKVVEVVKLVEDQEVVEKVVERVTTPAPTTLNDLVKAILISGLFHYLNNEVMYLALDNVHPITLAVGNTMKRVFIIFASILVFRNSVSFQAGVGSTIGIGGVLLYSLTKQHYEQKAKEASAPAAASATSKKKDKVVDKKKNIK